jgi:hypothetical protein
MLGGVSNRSVPPPGWAAPPAPVRRLAEPKRGRPRVPVRLLLLIAILAVAAVLVLEVAIAQ